MRIVMEKTSKANQDYISKNDAGAVKSYKEAIALGADLKGTEHLQLADSLDSVGKTNEAIAHYRIAIEKDPA